jgi:hypothetical protein
LVFCRKQTTGGENAKDLITVTIFAISYVSYGEKINVYIKDSNGEGD